MTIPHSVPKKQRKQRRAKNPTGYRTELISHTFSPKEKNLLDAVKKEYNVKYGTTLSTSDLIVKAIAEFNKKKKLGIALEERSLFKKARKKLKSFPPLEEKLTTGNIITVAVQTGLECEIFRVVIGTITGENLT